jgi:hypothetical protein
VISEWDVYHAKPKIEFPVISELVVSKRQREPPNILRREIDVEESVFAIYRSGNEKGSRNTEAKVERSLLK